MDRGRRGDAGDGLARQLPVVDSSYRSFQNGSTFVCEPDGTTDMICLRRLWESSQMQWRQGFIVVRTPKEAIF
jgi:hypothetical protein